MDSNLQNVLIALRQDLTNQGYFTPKIEQFFAALPTDNNQLIEGVVQFSADRENPLQNYYLVAYFLKYLSLPTEKMNILVSNVMAFLSQLYRQPLVQNEYALNTRLTAWSIVNNVYPNLSEESKSGVKLLLNQVLANQSEDEFTKNWLKDKFSIG